MWLQVVVDEELKVGDNVRVKVVDLCVALMRFDRSLKVLSVDVENQRVSLSMKVLARSRIKDSAIDSLRSVCRPRDWRRFRSVIGNVLERCSDTQKETRLRWRKKNRTTCSEGEQECPLVLLSPSVPDDRS